MWAVMRDDQMVEQWVAWSADCLAAWMAVLMAACSVAWLAVMSVE